MGQVGTRVLRWNGRTEDFQEDCHHIPDIVQDEFQAVQGQVAWVARRGQNTSDHLAFVEHELKCLWVQVHLEQKYLRHLIKEHVFVMDMVIFRTIFFELLVFFTFTLFTLHFAY